MARNEKVSNVPARFSLIDRNAERKLVPTSCPGHDEVDIEIAACINRTFCTVRIPRPFGPSPPGSITSITICMVLNKRRFGTLGEVKQSDGGLYSFGRGIRVGQRIASERSKNFGAMVNRKDSAPPRSLTDRESGSAAVSSKKCRNTGRQRGGQRLSALVIR